MDSSIRLLEGLGALSPSIRGKHGVDTDVLHENDHEFRRTRGAGVPADRVGVARSFIENIASSQRDRVLAFQAHDDFTFEDVHKRVRIVPVHGFRGTRRVIDRQDQHFLALDVVQLSHKLGMHDRVRIGAVGMRLWREKRPAGKQQIRGDEGSGFAHSNFRDGPVLGRVMERRVAGKEIGGKSGLGGQQTGIRHALQLEAADLLGHEVDEHTHAGRQVLAAQVTDVVPAVVRHVFRQARDERTRAQ
jgi:hypothetical protein